MKYSVRLSSYRPQFMIIYPRTRLSASEQVANRTQFFQITGRLNALPARYPGVSPAAFTGTRIPPGRVEIAKRRMDVAFAQ